MPHVVIRNFEASDSIAYGPFDTAAAAHLFVETYTSAAGFTFTVLELFEPETAEESPFRFGQRVRLTSDVDRFDSGIAPAGMTGVVVSLGLPWQGDDCFAVKLDAKLDWLDEWDNELHWPHDGAMGNPADDMEAY